MRRTKGPPAAYSVDTPQFILCLKKPNKKTNRKLNDKRVGKKLTISRN